MTDEEMLARADANYFSAMTTFIGGAERGEVRSKDGVLMAHSGTEVAAFNVAFVTRPPSDPGGTVASAIEFFEPRVPVISGHNQFWLWGMRGFDGNVVIDIDGDCGAKQHLFDRATKAATFTAPYVMPYEDNMPIMVCRGIRKPLGSIWPNLKHYE